MSGVEITLVNLINSFRGSLLPAQPAIPPNSILTGVAQWHAQDMARNDYVGIVGSDGEDCFRRIVCSGPTPKNGTGAIAVGYSTDPQAVFNAIQSDYAAFGVLYGTGLNTTMSVGYYGGYWMILLQ